MKKSSTYFFLSGLFFTAFMFVQFTNALAVPSWFKVFVIILATTYLISGIVQNRKPTNFDEDNNDDVI